MTLDEAINQMRSLQRDLDTGRLTVPYPDHVTAKIAACIEVFNQNPSDYYAIMARLEAVEKVEMELPW